MTSRELSPPVAVIPSISGPPSSTTVPAAVWRPRPKWRHPMVYVAALLFVGVGALLATKATQSPTTLGGSGSETATLTAPLPTTTSPGATSTTPALPTVAAQPDSNYLKLRVTTNPKETRILFDGSPLPPQPSPFEAKFPKDGAVHRITVEATGFYPQSKMVVFDKDQTLDFILHSKKGSPPPKDSPYH